MPLTAAAVTSLTVQSAPPKLWAEWLWLHFDGGWHNADGGSAIFPDVKLAFDQGDYRNRSGTVVEPLAGTGIQVVQHITAREAFLNETGRTCLDEAHFTFIVRTKIEGGAAHAGTSAYQCRLAAELLQGLLSNDGSLQVLAQKGIVNPEVLSAEVVPGEQYQTRMLRVGADLFYEQVT